MLDALKQTSLVWFISITRFGGLDDTTRPGKKAFQEVPTCIRLRERVWGKERDFEEILGAFAPENIFQKVSLRIV